jgi:AcrR family transcriptional regulator
MFPMSPRPRLSQDETAQHRRRFVEAAFRVIAATGDAAPAVRPVLREAGLSRQAFYRCFASKDELMVVVLQEGRRLLADYLAARMARTATPEGKIRAWVAGVMRQSEVASAAERTRPFIVSLGQRVALDEADKPDPDRVLYSLLEDAIAAGVADGSLDSADPAAAALIIYDYVIASLRRHLVRQVPPAPKTTQALSDFALRALDARVDQPAK